LAALGADQTRHHQVLQYHKQGAVTCLAKLQHDHCQAHADYVAYVPCISLHLRLIMPYAAWALICEQSPVGMAPSDGAAGASKTYSSLWH
jgi:hypothetical protein